ncbi:MAG: D-3-phosphoglycerate dehydrogenase (phosphoglycerate dehydrogenase)-like protein [Ramlibacter sp.]|nr:D-3-phosphoglycerate dehydrogenase (phosphoglycerate dehydrogenase)-like protein [Ramlibacter sp.]
MDNAAPLRILLSRETLVKLEAQLGQVLGTHAHELIAFDDPRARLADVAFVSRDVTGLSTKHKVLPATQQAYDAMRKAPGLRWAHIHSAGADRPVYQELMRRGVQVSTSSGANAPVVAQTALLGLLALARHWPRLLAAQRERRWAPLIASGLPRDLQGQTAVVVGWGPVGRELARLLQALGLEVVVVRRHEPPAPAQFRMVAHTRLHEVLPKADWLLLACPLTEETRGLIGAAELALLPPHCGLVNVSRGEVIAELALVEALRAQRLAGAYLDVFAQEPLPEDSPLWTLPNAIVTPHSAGFSDGNEQRVARMFLDNLGRSLRGEPLVNAAGSAQQV